MALYVASHYKVAASLSTIYFYLLCALWDLADSSYLTPPEFPQRPADALRRAGSSPLLPPAASSSHTELSAWSPRCGAGDLRTALKMFFLSPIYIDLLLVLRCVWRERSRGSPSSTVCPEGGRPPVTSFPGLCLNRYTMVAAFSAEWAGRVFIEKQLILFLLLQFQDPDFGSLSGGRVVRIAVNPDYQGVRTCTDLRCLTVQLFAFFH